MITFSSVLFQLSYFFSFDFVLVLTQALVDFVKRSQALKNNRSEEFLSSLLVNFK